MKKLNVMVWLREIMGFYEGSMLSFDLFVSIPLLRRFSSFVILVAPSDPDSSCPLHLSSITPSIVFLIKN